MSLKTASVLTLILARQTAIEKKLGIELTDDFKQPMSFPDGTTRGPDGRLYVGEGEETKAISETRPTKVASLPPFINGKRILQDGSTQFQNAPTGGTGQTNAPSTPEVDPKYHSGATFRIGSGTLMTVDHHYNGMVHVTRVAPEILEENPNHSGDFYPNQVTWVTYADGSDADVQ